MGSKMSSHMWLSVAQSWRGDGTDDGSIISLNWAVVHGPIVDG